ncbi:hypothetical protein ACOI1C_22475 [Bacillus sp. DJP31]|uniref:hypothetical protein n=1 Tax=Bacillus sp. DJP31 TaxID=3409789 RepID=UPI003BB73741
MFNKVVFNKELLNIISKAKDRGEEYIEVSSRDLHIKVGGYPGPSHNMPSCCAVMYEHMKDKDEILKAPKKGKGASLIIRYYL